eukprot:3774597-Rhodomonas_salina.3
MADPKELANGLKWSTLSKELSPLLDEYYGYIGSETQPPCHQVGSSPRDFRQTASCHGQECGSAGLFGGVFGRSWEGGCRVLTAAHTTQRRNALFCARGDGLGLSGEATVMVMCLGAPGRAMDGGQDCDPCLQRDHQGFLHAPG